MHEEKKIIVTKWLLRVGLAFVYGYAGIEIFFHPANFTKYLPTPVQNIIPIGTFLLIFSILEIILALWLISGFRSDYAGIVSFMLVTIIILTNMAYFDVLFRNVMISFASLALFNIESKT